MKQNQVKVGQRVLFEPDGSTLGTVTHVVRRKRTKTHSRVKCRVEWDTGREEWLLPHELREATDARSQG